MIANRVFDFIRVGLVPEKLRMLFRGYLRPSHVAFSRGIVEKEYNLVTNARRFLYGFPCAYREVNIKCRNYIVEDIFKWLLRSQIDLRDCHDESWKLYNCFDHIYEANILQ